ncbi:hypothetical protein Lser_V15G30141 [Lactuca serriola]
MHPNVFLQLAKELELQYGLESSVKMLVVEKLGIFLYTLALGVSNRDVGERFQRLGDTISRAFHEVLEAITPRGKRFKGLARDIIQPKDPTFQFIPSQIKNDKRYMPYFKRHASLKLNNCVTLVEKGYLLNVMATCDFDMCFTFASVGWEGSAHDTRVFLHAINTPSMNFPKPPEEHPDCIPIDELRDVRGSDTSSEEFYEGSNNMKRVRNDIATLIWNAWHLGVVKQNIKKMREMDYFVVAANEYEEKPRSEPCLLLMVDTARKCKISNLTND